VLIGSLPRASAEIFPGGQRRHFAYLFQVADVAMQIDVHKTLYPFYTTKKMLHVTVEVPNEALLWQQCFSHSTKLRGLLLSAVIVWLHYLPQMFVFNSYIQQISIRLLRCIVSKSIQFTKEDTVRFMKTNQEETKTSRHSFKPARHLC